MALFGGEASASALPRIDDRAARTAVVELASVRFHAPITVVAVVITSRTIWMSTRICGNTHRC